MTILESISGEIKSLAEWQVECDKFYQNLNAGREIQGKWERYKRILGLQPVGGEREWCGRKYFKEGRAKHDNE